MEDDTLYHRAEEAGAVACLLKPFHLETFVTTIQAALASAAQQAQAQGMTSDPGGDSPDDEADRRC